MRLSLLTWMEVNAYLQHSKGIVIPIGSTEQHGPNGLIGTDAICPEIIAIEAAHSAGFMVAPTFSVGMAQHHLGFSGTISLQPSTMIAVLKDWVASLGRHGFTHLYFLNGHGGNAATIDAAFSEIYAAFSFRGETAPLRLTRRNWWDLPGIMALSRQMYPRGLGSHATPSEVAVTYYAYPEARKTVAMTPKIAPNGPIRDASDYRRRFPDGRIGSDPSLADAEGGRRLVEASALALITDYQSFLET
ncbi:MAG: creatininase family protein [Alphaproteobacteria bacterium]